MRHATVLCAILALAVPVPVMAAGTEGDDRPACKELEKIYIELAERSDHTPDEAEINEAVYGANPTNAECAAMLALFPEQD